MWIQNFSYQLVLAIQLVALVLLRLQKILRVIPLLLIHGHIALRSLVPVRDCLPRALPPARMPVVPVSLGLSKCDLTVLRIFILGSARCFQYLAQARRVAVALGLLLSCLLFNIRHPIGRLDEFGRTRRAAALARPADPNVLLKLSLNLLQHQFALQNERIFVGVPDRLDPWRVRIRVILLQFFGLTIQHG